MLNARPTRRLVRRARGGRGLRRVEHRRAARGAWPPSAGRRGPSRRSRSPTARVAAKSAPVGLEAGDGGRAEEPDLAVGADAEVERRRRRAARTRRACARPGRAGGRARPAGEARRGAALDEARVDVGELVVEDVEAARVARVDDRLDRRQRAAAPRRSTTRTSTPGHVALDERAVGVLREQLVEHAAERDGVLDDAVLADALARALEVRLHDAPGTAARRGRRSRSVARVTKRPRGLGHAPAGELLLGERLVERHA